MPGLHFDVEQKYLAFYLFDSGLHSQRETWDSLQAFGSPANMNTYQVAANSNCNKVKKALQNIVVQQTKCRGFSTYTLCFNTLMQQLRNIVPIVKLSKQNAQPKIIP